MAVPRAPWGAGGRLPGCGDQGWGWRCPHRAPRSPRSHAQIRARLCLPRPGPPPPLRGDCGLRAPTAPSSVLVPTPELRPRSRGFPGSRLRGRQRRGGGGGGNGGRRTARRTPGSSPPDARQHPARLLVPLGAPRSEPPEPGMRAATAAASHAARAERGAGVGKGARWGLAVTPPVSHHRLARFPARAAPGTQQPGTRWPKEQSRGL